DQPDRTPCGEPAGGQEHGAQDEGQGEDRVGKFHQLEGVTNLSEHSIFPHSGGTIRSARPCGPRPGPPPYSPPPRRSWALSRTKGRPESRSPRPASPVSNFPRESDERGSPGAPG